MVKFCELKKCKQISNLQFFEDVDTKVRNAFLHLDFELSGAKIFYTTIDQPM